MASDDSVSPVHVDDLPWTEGGHGDVFAHRRRKLARSGAMLGCSLMELPPGKTAFPFHAHLANEEAIYLLEGEATLRVGTQRHRVRAGHYVAFPRGEEYAHQLTNTSDAPCRYLVLSTMIAPDVTVYPDSDKVGVMAGSAPGGDPHARTLSLFLPRDAELDYWAGEPIGPGETGARVPPAATGPQEASRPPGAPRPDASRSRFEDFAQVSSRVRARIEEKIEHLRAAVGQANPARREADAEPSFAAEDDQDAALERQVDEEIATLKRKLGID